MEAAFIYTNKYLNFDYGPYHPLRIARLALTYQLILSCGLLTNGRVSQIESPEATDQELLAFHTGSYLNALKKADTGDFSVDLLAYGMGPGDNPVFQGLLQWSKLLAGATLAGARMVAQRETFIAFNIAGGMHHAYPDRASGFCYVNDPVLALKYLLSSASRVLYLDIDAHHGDGVQTAFYETPQVLTISFHQNGRTLFPGTGFTYEMGSREGKGYAVNIPLAPGADDEIFLFAFREIAVPIIETYKPEFMVTQLGVDTFSEDPLAGLNLGTRAFSEVVGHLKSLNIGWLALGGGGYNIFNVARAWTMAWAIMSGQTLPEDIPQDFRDRYKDLDESIPMKFHDPAEVQDTGYKERAWQEAREVVSTLKSTIFPFHGLNGTA